MSLPRVDSFLRSSTHKKHQQLLFPQPPSHKISHQLKNEGCLCQFCQNINNNLNKIINQQHYQDLDSQGNKHLKSQSYLWMIDQFVQWQKKYPRIIRFALPQICAFDAGHPVYWVHKGRQSLPTKVVRSKGKMNMFQIQHFFLQGFIMHNPALINKKKKYHGFKDKTTQCLVAAKYANNVTQMLTLQQIGSLFKSKFNYMSKGLEYLQTVVGSSFSKEVSLKIDLDRVQKTKGDLLARAKQQARIIIQQTKVTHAQYHSQQKQIQFQRQLRAQNQKDLLLYLSLKMILVSSRNRPSIITQSIFKWVVVSGTGGGQFLWDVHIQQQSSSDSYWQNSVTQALQIKLKKTMSMMQLNPQTHIDNNIVLSPKARQMSQWLEMSTAQEWREMKIIRNRLEKLEEQKRALLESQKAGHSGIMNRSFRVRARATRKVNGSTLVG